MTKRTESTPRVSVIIATRERPQDLARCLHTVLANDYADFEVLVIDQSTSDASEKVALEIADERLRYWRQRLVGKSRALNWALAQAQGEIIAFTDDDCSVPPEWLRLGVETLSREPGVGVLFGKLMAAPHEARELFVPTFSPPRYRRLRGRRALAIPWMGVGANMFAPREVLDRLSGFDECLGPGGRFRGGVDMDLAYRALRAGFSVVQDPENTVVHWGERSYADGSARTLLRNNYYGAGARLVKQIRCGDLIAGYVLIRNAFGEVVRLAGSLVGQRRGTGAGRLFYLALGAVHGLGQPLDRRRLLYRPKRTGSAS